MATAGRYPLSSPDGQAIPLEVIKPLGVLVINHTSAGFTPVTIPDLFIDKIFIAFTTQDCYISTSATPTTPVVGTVATNLIYVPSTMTVAFVGNSSTLNVKSLAASGQVILQIVDTWASLALEQQITRR